MFACATSDLRVAVRHILTQPGDVLLAGVVQLRLQADVLRLQRFQRDLGGFTENKQAERKKEREKEKQTQTGLRTHPGIEREMNSRMKNMKCRSVLRFYNCSTGKF